MDLAKALKQRDSVVIATIQTDFLKKTLNLSDDQTNEAIKQIRTSFNEGTNEWAKTYLPIVAGEKEAESILQILQTEDR